MGFVQERFRQIHILDVCFFMSKDNEPQSLRGVLCFFQALLEVIEHCIKKSGYYEIQDFALIAEVVIHGALAHLCTAASLPHCFNIALRAKNFAAAVAIERTFWSDLGIALSIRFGSLVLLRRS